MAAEVSSFSASSSDNKRTEVGYNPNPIPKDNAQETLPRVSTARVPILNTVPSEIHLNRNRLRKSTEEAKLITVQKFAHGKILDIGSEIHRLTANKVRREREEAVVEAENKVWEHAEEIRIKALEDLQAKLRAEHEEVLSRIRKEHDKVLKEEGLRVETALRQQSLDKVKREREEGEKRLQRAVAAAEERCRLETVRAVEEARRDERTKANAELEALDRSWQTKFNDIIDEMNADKKRELLLLGEEKDWEKQRAVLQTRQVERESASNELKRTSNNYESRIQVLNHKIQEKESEVRKVDGEKRKADDFAQELGRELFLTRDTFRGYIHQVCECMPGQADYQMPGTKFTRSHFL